MIRYIFEQSYYIGNKLIDSQHAKLFEIFDKLFNAMQVGKGRFVIIQIFNELKDYTNYHFNAEEELMQKLNYPEYNRHKEEHSIFIFELNNLIDSYNKNNYDITLKTLDFLYYWILNHILASDKKIQNYIDKTNS